MATHSAAARIAAVLLVLCALFVPQAHAGPVTYAPASQTPSTADLTVMFAGDSQVTALGDGWRTATWIELLRRRGAVRLVGSQCTPGVAPYRLGDCHHEGWPGYKIAELRAGRAGVGGLPAAVTAGVTRPDVLVVMIGSNDVSAYAADIHAATKTQGQAVALMIADTRALVSYVRSTWVGTRVVLSTLPPWVSPAANATEGGPLVVAFNAALLASGLGDARVDATSALTAADMQADGIHTAAPAHAAIGAALARAVDTVAPSTPAGTPWSLGPWSPPFIKRAAQASISMPNTSLTQDAASLPAVTGDAIGAQSFVVSFNWHPTSLVASLKSIWTLTGSFSNAVSICSNGATMAVYSAGSGSPAIQTVDAPGVLIAGQWHHVVAWWDAGSTSVSLYVNGALVARKATAATWTLAGSVPAVLGYTSNFAIGAATGYIDNVSLAVGTSLPAASRQWTTVAAMYLRGTQPPGLVALYRADEGTGTALAEALGGTAGSLATGGSLSTTWVASTVAAKPWGL